MSPRAEFASRNFHVAGQRLEVELGSAGVGAALLQWRSVKLAGPRPHEGPTAAESAATSSAAAAVSLPARSLKSCCG
jgi:hypothetical protein